MIIIDHLLFLSSAADAVNSLIRLTHCLLMPFETHRQITVEANVAGGCKKYQCFDKLAVDVV